MGLRDVLFGRTKPSRPNLEHLFALPGARITLEASGALVPTGQAGVCFKPTVGPGFDATETEIADLLRLDDDHSATAELNDKPDSFGYRWAVVKATDFDALVTTVHVVNTTLEEHGYGPQLLCSVFGFAASIGDPASTYLVYLYKRGTFYPFVPTGPERRDNETELRIKAQLAGDLAIESDLDRWFPLWELPVH